MESVAHTFASLAGLVAWLEAKRATHNVSLSVQDATAVELLLEAFKFLPMAELSVIECSMEEELASLGSECLRQVASASASTVAETESVAAQLINVSAIDHATTLGSISDWLQGIANDASLTLSRVEWTTLSSILDAPTVLKHMLRLFHRSRFEELERLLSTPVVDVIAQLAVAPQTRWATLLVDRVLSTLKGGVSSAFAARVEPFLVSWRASWMDQVRAVVYQRADRLHQELLRRRTVELHTRLQSQAQRAMASAFDLMTEQWRCGSHALSCGIEVVHCCRDGKISGAHDDRSSTDLKCEWQCVLTEHVAATRSSSDGSSAASIADAAAPHDDVMHGCYSPSPRSLVEDTLEEIKIEESSLTGPVSHGGSDTKPHAYAYSDISSSDVDATPESMADQPASSHEVYDQHSTEPCASTDSNASPVQDLSNMCPYRCTAPDHGDQTSYCTLPAQHDPASRPRRVDRYTYAHGHRFLCIHLRDARPRHFVAVFEAYSVTKYLKWLLQDVRERLAQGFTDDVVSVIVFGKFSTVRMERTPIVEFEAVESRGLLKVPVTPAAWRSRHLTKAVYKAADVLSRHGGASYRQELCCYWDEKFNGVEALFKLVLRDCSSVKCCGYGARAIGLKVTPAPGWDVRRRPTLHYDVSATPRSSAPPTATVKEEWQHELGQRYASVTPDSPSPIDSEHNVQNNGKRSRPTDEEDESGDDRSNKRRVHAAP